MVFSPPMMTYGSVFVRGPPSRMVVFLQKRGYPQNGRRHMVLVGGPFKPHEGGFMSTNRFGVVSHSHSLSLRGAFN